MSTAATPSSLEASAPPHAASAIARKARFWDRIAAKYAADPIADMAGYQATLVRVQGLLRTSQDVLEIGCGTGTTALHLAPFTKSLLATDISAKMIDIARAKLQANPIPQLSFALADADTPIACSEDFDVVLAFNVLHLVRDLDQTIAAAKQALRPGGLLVSKTFCISEMNPLMPHIALPLMRAVGKAPKVICFDAQSLQAAFVRQGMEVVSVERHGTQRKDFRVFVVARKPA